MDLSPNTILAETQSLCPICLKLLPAQRVQKKDKVYLEKTCPEHGFFSTIVWQGQPLITDWVRPKIPSYPQNPATQKKQGCPFDCGLCPDHRQHTCTALFEITVNCNLGCPICFAESKGGKNPDQKLSTIAMWCESVLKASGPRNIQLSGGEPTCHKDLEAVVKLVKDYGFSFIQLNTNGLLLAQDKTLAKRLKKAGLSSVFLQFDGTEDAIYQKIRGKSILKQKLEAIENCVRQGLGVVLVTTLIHKVNAHNIGEILRFGLSKAPGVRGVHFQPISYFGRYPFPPKNEDRITLPQVMRAIEEQTQRLMRISDFHPPGCENALCSFSAAYIKKSEHELKLINSNELSCNCLKPEEAYKGADRSVAFVARQWSSPPEMAKPETLTMQNEILALDDFLYLAKTHTFTVSAMAFQDAWNLDLERVKDCCIHETAQDGRLIPFCLYNLTNTQGKSLYRGVKK